MTAILTHFRFRLAQEPEQIRKLGKQISGPLEIMSDELATDYERAAAKNVLRRNIGRFEEARARVMKITPQQHVDDGALLARRCEENRDGDEEARRASCECVTP